MSEKYKIRVDEESFTLEDDAVRDMDIYREGSKLLIWLNGKKYITEPRRIDQKKYEVRIEGITFQVEIMDELDQKIKEMGLAEEIASGLGDTVAPMPGLVLETNVKEGDEVEEGQTIIILEAMKMENVIKAPATGTITDICVKKGETVDKNAVLFTLE